MKREPEIELTDEELEKVNKIISGIQSDIKSAIEAINNNSFDKALGFLDEGMKKTNCPLCHKKLTLLKADIVHTKTVCPIDADLCTAEKEAVTDTAIGLKDEFVPMANKKKAIKDKKKELEKLNELNPPRSGITLPSPHEIFTSLFKKKR